MGFHVNLLITSSFSGFYRITFSVLIVLLSTHRKIAHRLWETVHEFSSRPQQSQTQNKTTINEHSYAVFISRGQSTLLRLLITIDFHFEL